MNNGGFLSTQSVRENQLANLSKQIDDLKDQLQQKENIIKEVREYIKNLREEDEYLEELHFSYEDKYKLLEILDKEVN